MSEARIESVTITTGEGEQVFTVDPEAEGPQSVTVTMAGGRKVTVNADGGLSLDDGRTVTIGADGSIQVKRRARSSSDPGGGKYGVNIGPGSRGTQIGHGNTQVNSF
jgi:hypothetical protein